MGTRQSIAGRVVAWPIKRGHGVAEGCTGRTSSEARKWHLDRDEARESSAGELPEGIRQGERGLRDDFAWDG